MNLERPTKEPWKYIRNEKGKIVDKEFRIHRPKVSRFKPALP